MRQLFGTDGIRGVAGEFPLDKRTAFAVGVALGQWVNETHSHAEVVLGMDTRESGPWLARHVAGGLHRVGVHARFAGLITTPGLAFTAGMETFAAGVMVSASHNPYRDNGLKIFNHSGFKLPDETEQSLEKEIFAWLKSGEEPESQPLAVDEGLDRAYIDHLAATLPAGLQGARIVVDTANGAASYLAPALLEQLGAEVECIHCSPDGKNINLNCGSQHLESLRARVLASGADLGVAFDGDADRALFVSHSGKLVDGDAVLLLTALPLHARGELKEVVATVMSNLGLERALKRHGIGLVRTSVGDKYVLEEMLRRNAPIGGEQSGHIIFRDFATTGDGMLTALRVLEVMRESGKDLDTLTAELEIYPQLLVNVRVRERKPLDELQTVKAEVHRTEREFGEAGRVLVRFSGTEPLARVMVEGPQLERVKFNANAIADAIRGEIGE
ncbi:MAG: phosphoglucosamine mutase [Bryobacterales bacterium]|nr:phosphoglucosamine mutase [Bryobacterales bacterium]MBV9399153.1 phosphoglucosamine mutase [Bryobacterales bacterium]